MAQRFPFMNLMVAKGANYPTSAGTASAPVAANALIAHDVTWAKTEERLPRLQVDGEPGIIVADAVAKEAWTVEFKTYLSGSGAAGTPPAWGLAMRACGMTETIVPSGGSAGTTYTVASIHANHEWCDLRGGWALEDYFAHGARGNFQLELSANALPTIQWTMNGIYNVPTNSAMLTPVYANQAPAVPIDAGNMPTFTLGSTPYSACVSGFTYSPNNTIVFKSDGACIQEVMIATRAPGGQIIIRTPDELSSFNAWQKARNGALDPVACQFGPVGNRVTVNLTGIAYASPQVTDGEGFKYWTIPYTCSKAAGSPSVGSIVIA